MKISQEDIGAVKAGLPGAEDAAIPASDREKMMAGSLSGAATARVQKPPLGVMPEHVWREQRITALAAAIARHGGGDFELVMVSLWVREMYTHTLWLEQADNERQSK